MIQWTLAIWPLIPLPFVNPACTSGRSWFTLLKPSLKDFEHFFASVWDECSCAVVWMFFGIAFLWDWSENWSFLVLWPLLSFLNLLTSWVQLVMDREAWHAAVHGVTKNQTQPSDLMNWTDWVQHFHTIIFSDSTRIPSPPLALFVVILPKAHLTSHSRMSGSRWVITPLWLSGSLRSSVYSCHLYLASSASVRSIPFLSFIVPIFAWNVPLVSLIFLMRSLLLLLLLSRFSCVRLCATP